MDSRKPWCTYVQHTVGHSGLVLWKNVAEVSERSNKIIKEVEWLLHRNNENTSFQNISKLETTLPQKLGQPTNCRLDISVVCTTSEGYDVPLQHHHNNNGYQDFVRKMDHLKHQGSPGLPNQHLSLPAPGRRARWATCLLRGHFFHTCQS